MKQYKKCRETIERDVLVSIHCDWCRQAMPPLTVAYEVREFELSFRTGYAYPEGGSATGWQVQDLCDDCVGKLRSLLENQGISITEVDTDY